MSNDRIDVLTKVYDRIEERMGRYESGDIQRGGLREALQIIADIQEGEYQAYEAGRQ